MVDICIDGTRIQDASNTVLVKAVARQNCTCELSIINQNRSIGVNIERYKTLKSSRPSNSDCGLVLDFYFGSDLLWEANCSIDNIFATSINMNNVMTIRSMTVNGMLKSNEGYCVGIKRGKSYFI